MRVLEVEELEQVGGGAGQWHKLLDRVQARFGPIDPAELPDWVRDPAKVREFVKGLRERCATPR